jgi:hypothetical protein
VAEGATRALRKLAAHVHVVDHGVTIAAAGGNPLLVSALGRQRAVAGVPVVDGIVGTLWNLALGAGSKGAIAVAGGIPALKAAVCVCRWLASAQAALLVRWLPSREPRPRARLSRRIACCPLVSHRVVPLVAAALIVR